MNALLCLIGALCLTTSVPAPESEFESCKPLPPVLVEWRVTHRTSGELQTEIVVTPRRATRRLHLSAALPPELELIDTLPAELTGIAADETVILPLRLRVRGPATGVPTLRVQIETDRGSYGVGTTLPWGPPRALHPEPLRVADGEAEFAAPLAQSSSLTSGVLPGAVAVTGRFLYRDRLVGPEGFLHGNPADNPNLPVRHADVRLVQNGIVVETSSTADDGTYAFTFVPQPGFNYQISLRARTSNWGGTSITILQVGTSFYSYLTANQPGQPVLDFGTVVFEPGAGGEVFNILDALLDGAFLVESLDGAQPTTALTAQWPADRTAFNKSGNHIQLLPDEGYDDSVILHEYGHYVSWNYSKDSSPGGTHFVDDDGQDPRLSWGEGFASYFQSAAREYRGDPYPSWYVDTQGTPGAGQLFFSYDAEEPTYAVSGAGSEVAVQAMLWDIEDSPATADPFPGEDDDPLVASRSLIWAALEGLKTRSVITVEDFWEAWFLIGNGFDVAMRSTFAALGAEYFPDGFESDDVAGGPLALNGQPSHHTLYPSGDIDRHSIPLQAGDAVTVETLSLLGITDTELRVFDPQGELVALSSNRSASDRSSVIGFTADQTGTYVADVRREFTGPAAFTEFGSYDLRALSSLAGATPLTTTAAGVQGNGYSTGAAFADANLDGLPDLYVVNNTRYGSPYDQDTFLRNVGNGVFTDATSSAGFTGSEGSVGAAWGDYDNDGDPDLFVTDHALYQNNGTGVFTDVTLASGLTDIGREFDAMWLDTDGDGLLDLFVVGRDVPSALWHNNGDGTFTDVAPQAGFNFPANGEEAYGCSWSDMDGDRRPDILLTKRDGRTQVLYRNLGGDQFEDVTASAGLESTVPASGSSWGDVDGDGLQDLFVASTGQDRLYRNRGDGTFENVSLQYGINNEAGSQGSGFADYDLDGDLDLFVANLSAPDGMFENLGAGMMRLPFAADPGFGFAAAWEDVDGDGDPDLFLGRGCTVFGSSVVSCQPNLLYLSGANTTSSTNRSWLKVDLVGVESSRDGLGALVRVHAGGVSQTREAGNGGGWASKGAGPLLFGFSATATIDSVEVFWPNHRYNLVQQPSLNATLVITEDIQTPVDPLPTVRPFAVSAAFPNPFRAATSVSLRLDVASEVRVEIFDTRGRVVREILNRRMEPGTHIVGWDGRDSHGAQAAVGVYFYRAKAGGESLVRKLVLAD